MNRTPLFTISLFCLIFSLSLGLFGQERTRLETNVFSKANLNNRVQSTSSNLDATILRWDSGINDDAIGLTQGGTFQVAASFPASMMGAYTGQALTQVIIYINDVPNPCVLKVYDQGTPNTPGALLYSETLTVTGDSWNTITLATPVPITGNDIWVGYECTHTSGTYPAGCDAGPAVLNGDWIYFNGAWDRLVVATGGQIDVNWNIAAVVEQLGPPCPVQTPVNPNPASGAVDVPITGVTLSWSNGGPGTVPPTQVEVFFGPTGNMTSVYSGAPITQWAVPGSLNYFTNYQWRVVNKIDTCNISSSTWAFKTMQDPNLVEYCEPFNDLNNWTIVGPMGMTNWSAYNSSNAGGTSPELRMSYSPTFTGKSLIRSNSMTLLNNWLTTYSFQFYLSHYTNPSGVITVSITYDGGVTEQILYQLNNPTSGIGPITVNGYFITPATGSDNAQIQIWYEGYSYNINWICWDDLCIRQIISGPGAATNPNPADGATNINVANLTLSWTNPSGATSNEVWFGTEGNLQLIHSGSLVSSVNAPTPLSYSTEYYWQVNEIDANGTTPGVTWKFKTQMDPNIVTLFWDEFENGLGLWDITNNGGTCVWLIYFPPYPNAYSLPATSSGGVLAADVDECGSGSSLLSSATIISILDASYYESVSLEFDNDFRILNATDEGYVEVSTDGGTTWTVVWQVLGVDKRNTHEVVNLSSYVANKAFKLRFRSVQPGWHWWWVVDNVYVYAWDFVPVELTSFTAKGSVNEVELSWITATETNNQGFEIQRDDGKGFVPITFVKGFGTTTEAHAYSYIDKGLKVGTYSYRLKQVDLNGTFSYSDVIEAEVIAPAVFALEQNYPNPFNPTTNINYQLNVDSKVTLKIFDILGQEIATLVNENLEAGKHTAVFNASQLSSGVYMYKLEARGVDGSSFISVKKMLLTK